MTSPRKVVIRLTKPLKRAGQSSRLPIRSSSDVREKSEVGLCLAEIDRTVRRLRFATVPR